MTDTATPNVSPDPADLIREAVSAGLAAKPAAEPAPDATEPAADRPAKASAAPEPMVAPRPAKAPAKPLAGLGGWARALPAYVPALNPKLRWPAAAAGMVLAAGLGFGAAHLASTGPEIDANEQRWSEAAAGLKQTHADVLRLATELKSMRASLDTLKSDRPRVDLAKQSQLNDKVDKAAADNAARVAKLAEQLDRIEKTQRDPARLATFVERLDRIEKQTASLAEKAAAPTPPPKPVALAPAPSPDVTQTGSIAEAKPAPKPAEFDPRKTQLDTHILRDVDNDAALIEARNGRVFEVHAGQSVAGLGKIEAIERRGRHWVVVTSKGFIGDRLP
jgi:hypothetical protein